MKNISSQANLVETIELPSSQITLARKKKPTSQDRPPQQITSNYMIYRFVAVVVLTVNRTFPSIHFIQQAIGT